MCAVGFDKAIQGLGYYGDSYVGMVLRLWALIELGEDVVGNIERQRLEIWHDHGGSWQESLRRRWWWWS